MLKHIFLSFLLFLLGQTSYGGDMSNYSFTTYNSEFGFVQKEVMKIMQDRNGQMWFATWDGLYRFDGYRFSNYKARPGDGIRLESNRLESISEDGDNIWMRGYNGSISRFNKRTTRIDNLPMRNYVAQDMLSLAGGGVMIRMADNRVVVAYIDSASDNIVVKVVFSPGKSIKVNKIEVGTDHDAWIMTSCGILRYGVKKRSVRLMCRGVDCHGMKIGKNATVFGCARGCYVIWKNGRLIRKKLPTQATINSVAIFNDEKVLFSTLGDGLFLADCHYTAIRHFTSSNSCLPSDNISAMVQDSYGDMWFGTNKPGVMHYRYADGRLQHLRLQGEFSGDPSMWRNDIKIVEDSRGNLWLTPSGNGMAMYDREKDRLIPFLDKDRHYAWTAENTVIDMFVDRQDNVWFCGKYTGLQKATYNAQPFNTLNHFAPTESGRDVRGLFQDSKGRIWLGARSGVISVYDSNLNFIGNLSADGTLSKNCNSQIGHAYSFVEQRDGVIWIATKFNGLIRLQPKGHDSFVIRHFVADCSRYSLPHNDIFSLFIDRHNRLWGATFGGGVFYTSLEDGKFRFIHSGNRLTHYPILHYNRTRYISADRHGDLWLCTTSGLMRFRDDFKKPEDIRFVAYTRHPEDATSLSYNDVLEVYFTKADSMYVCTYGGGFCKVSRCQGDSLRFQSFTMANGLRSDVVFSVQEDNSGNLWFASESGLVKYSPRQNSIENFSSRFFGKQIDINEGMSLRLRDGRLLYPSRNYTAVYFTPERIRVSRFVPEIMLTRLFIDQVEQQPNSDDDAVLDCDINSVRRITLPPSKNSFNIEFAALDYRDPSNISYAYKLEGIDSEWNMTGNQHNATYNNLPPGKYILKIRSTNSDGVWVDNVREVEIDVTPSFWQTGWAWLLYAIIAVLLICITTYVLATILQLKQKVAIEQQISDLKMKFFTNISHEIRTPLTLISGSVKEMLRHGTNEKYISDALHVVDNNSDRLLRLVTQILDIRKIESGNMKLSLQKIDVGEFVASLMKNFRNIANERGVSLHLHNSAGHLAIWADAEKLDKILFNLLSNAFRFTPKDRCIYVEILSQGDGVCIKVVDQGKGISPERQNSIFRLFSSDNEGSVVSQPHTGIGLALTKELVELHHGKISVESVLGKGSTFIVFLPGNMPGTNQSADYIIEDNVAQKVVDGGNVAAQIAEGVKHGCDEGTECGCLPADKPVILVVEDNAEMRDFISLILRDEYCVVKAVDGKAGLEKAVTLQPDIVISDYMMPVMDGMEMARQLRGDMATSHIPIVMLSARTDEDSVILGLRTGVDAYIEKPFSADVLRARVGNLIVQRRHLQQVYIDRFVNKSHTSSVVPCNTELGGPTADGVTSVNDADQRFLERLTLLLEDNISNGDLSVDDVARMMGMSRSVYFKKLKALTGIGPNDYFKSLRMQRAAEMLNNGELSVTEISYRIGIADSHYFSKCFKQKFGVTPTEWRKRLQMRQTL